MMELSECTSACPFCGADLGAGRGCVACAQVQRLYRIVEVLPVDELLEAGSLRLRVMCFGTPVLLVGWGDAAMVGVPWRHGNRAEALVQACIAAWRLSKDEAGWGRLEDAFGALIEVLLPKLEARPELNSTLPGADPCPELLVVERLRRSAAQQKRKADRLRRRAAQAEAIASLSLQKAQDLILEAQARLTGAGLEDEPTLGGSDAQLSTGGGGGATTPASQGEASGARLDIQRREAERARADARASASIRKALSASGRGGTTTSAFPGPVFVFQDGWEQVVELLEHFVPKVSYVVLYERSAGETITLERYDRERCLAVDEPDLKPEGLDDGLFLEHLKVWIQAVSRNQAVGTRLTRIQCRAYKPKGSGTVFSRQFSVFNRLQRRAEACPDRRRWRDA